MTSDCNSSRRMRRCHDDDRERRGGRLSLPALKEAARTPLSSALVVPVAIYTTDHRLRGNSYGGRHQTTTLDWMVSVDDHLLEPASVWQTVAGALSRCCAAPGADTRRRVLAVRMTDAYPPAALRRRRAAQRRLHAERDQLPDIPPAAMTSTPARRHERRWHTGIALFPVRCPRFCGQIFYEAKDKDLALLCSRQYNTG